MKSNKVQKHKTKIRHLLAQDTGQTKKTILDKSSVTLTERNVNGEETADHQRGIGSLLDKACETPRNVPCKRAALRIPVCKKRETFD